MPSLLGDADAVHQHGPVTAGDLLNRYATLVLLRRTLTATQGRYTGPALLGRIRTTNEPGGIGDAHGALEVRSTAARADVKLVTAEALGLGATGDEKHRK